ncbi:DinB family protein [Saccharothrix sp. NPDC042600]|uniref:DinB family protein n=1 Tax=Saccharothrix TaxID=2071 RepID=UPI0033D34D3A|nr:DinB family protein [Saccharothrix mutabilis subsp. capreolus]
MGEKEALAAFLGAQRASVLAILEGLDEAALRTPVLPSGWTPLGMVEHLGHAERHWFQEVVTGRADPAPGGDDPPLTSSRPVAEVFAFYREQCALSDAVLAATPLSAVPVGRHPEPFADQIHEFRDVVLHMIEETARHAGHLDVARELLDGTTGLGPR